MKMEIWLIEDKPGDARPVQGALAAIKTDPALLRVPVAVPGSSAPTIDMQAADRPHANACLVKLLDCTFARSTHAERAQRPVIQQSHIG